MSNTKIEEPKKKMLSDRELDALINPTKAIILYNDPVNTFPHVIECLMKYCDHAKEQAEQCAIIVHHKGKTDIKHGDLSKLKPIAEALLENGLSVKIEE